MKSLTDWLASNTPLDAQPNKLVEMFAAERMNALGISTIDGYVARLDQDAREALILHQHLAPPETWLFRYAAAFELLREELLKRDRATVFHVASLGCATGSEPFSIAATALSCGLHKDQFRILALDYSDEHLDAARTGRVSAVAQRTPIPAWASPWFHPTKKGQLELDARGMAMIDFVKADLSTWKPGRDFDFVFCRNVAIYLNDSAKSKLGRLLCDMAKPLGLIFLGHADSAMLARTEARRMDADQAFAFSKSQKPSLANPSAAIPAVPPPLRTVQKIFDPPKKVAPAPVAVELDLFAQAQAAADCGDLPVAEKSLTSILAANPADPKAHLLLGCVQMSQKNFAQAERSFTKVVYLDPANSLGLLSLAAIADMRGDAEIAERFRERAARTFVEPPS